MWRKMKPTIKSSKRSSQESASKIMCGICPHNGEVNVSLSETRSIPLSWQQFLKYPPECGYRSLNFLMYTQCAQSHQGEAANSNPASSPDLYVELPEVMPERQVALKRPSSAKAWGGGGENAACGALRQQRQYEEIKASSPKPWATAHHSTKAISTQQK